MSILGEDLSARSLLLLLTFSMFGDVCSSNGYFGFKQFWCEIPSKYAMDVEYMIDFNFNGEMLMTYNSTEEKYTGHTPLAVDKLSLYNNPSQIEKNTMEKQRFCIDPAAEIWNVTEENTAEPKVRLRSVKPLSSRHPAMLVCSAYDFYPKQIKVTWRKDGQDVTSDVISTEERSNIDWTYQIHTYLEYTPKVGERITCMVEHASFSSPMLYDWVADPLPESERNKIAVGASGLLLGMACVAAGLIKYRQKSTAGRVLVPTS